MAREELSNPFLVAGATYRILQRSPEGEYSLVCASAPIMEPSLVRFYGPVCPDPLDVLIDAAIHRREWLRRAGFDLRPAFRTTQTRGGSRE